jgi:alkylation response protein AidB-like acyl-CoA dehydrogenase
MEEVSWADASHSVIMSVNNSLVCEPILRFGSPEQKQHLLPGLASAEYLGAYCLSEPGCGSDAANMQATARRQGEEWILNGTKSWITNGGEAGVYLVYAVSNPRCTAVQGHYRLPRAG